MSDTALIAQAFGDAGRPLTLEEVLEATQLEDQQKARGLIYHLVNQKRLLKADPTDDGISRWCCPSVDPGAVSPPSEPERRLGYPATSVTAQSTQDARLPEVCMNLHTGVIVISYGDDTISIESLTAAQHLLAQMKQAIAALGALLDGR
jgi:hypothetical protein